MFLEELYQLTLNSLLIKQYLCNYLLYYSLYFKNMFFYLAFHLEDFLLILSISYDDNLRFNCLKMLSLLINNSQLSFKYLNRICYEYLYNFDIYYEKIQSLTIESRIIYLTKQNLNDLNHQQIIPKDLEEKIIEAINQLGGYVFFKMHRSPKDAYQSKLSNF
jgi:hypothetical protein